MFIALSITLTIISVFLWKDSIHSRLFSLKIALVVFVSFLFSGIYYFSKLITGQGIDESVLFHLSADMTGAGFSEFSNLILYGIIYIFAILSVSFYVYRVVKTKYKVKTHKIQTSAALISLVLAYLINPGVMDISKLYLSVVGSSSKPPPEEYFEVSGHNLNINNKNIVYIYLESVERTYFNEELFPGLTPNLKRLESQSLSFGNVGQIYGSGWTIAGLVNTQCGIPLVTPSQGNSMSGADQFLPEANCLGDILNIKGYNLNYLGGADLDFAGKGEFFRTHGFDSVKGLNELLPEIGDSQYRSSWGLYDDSLFEIAKRRYDELMLEDKPFGLFMLTLDTHHPIGHMAAYCDEISYNDGTNPILNAVHCADEMVANFVEHIRNSPGYDNTIIVISSDHLAMKNSASEMLGQGERKNLLMFLGENIKSAYNNNPAALIDVAPTLLGLLGSEINGLGFGRNLLADTSLTESMSDVSSFLSSHRGFISDLWSFPQLNRGLKADLENKNLVLGSRSISYPALLILDENIAVEEVRFEFHSPTKLIEQVLDRSSEQRFIWADRCSKVSALTAKRNDQEYCVAFGALGSDRIKVTSLNNEMEFSFKEIRRFFKQADNISEEQFLDRLKKLELTKKFGISNPQVYKPENVLEGNFILISAGFHNGATLAANLNVDVSKSTSRGLTLYGLNSNAPPTIIQKLDTCGSTVKELMGYDYKFQDDISRHKNSFGAFAILAHDSGICGQRDFESLFSGTGLSEWSDIGFRTPYIGVISGNGAIKEFHGEPETAIAIQVKDFIRPPMSSRMQRESMQLPSIAHAGGGFQGKTYTNSIDALNANSDLYSLFEIDFSWTSDGELVCLHDWSHSYKRSFGLEPEGKKTLSEFKSLVNEYSEFEKCTLDSLTKWLQKNEHARIVTDVKESNIKALSKIATEYPELQHRFIPQVYQPIEYFEAKGLGFDDVIWTLYRFNGDDDAVLAHLDQMDIYALTMPQSRANRSLGERALESTGVLSYVHTINSQEQADHYRTLGINNIYTDFLPQPTPTFYKLTSSGWSAGASSIQSLATNDTINLLRGLTLVGIKSGESPVKLAHFDTCGAGAVKDTVGLDGNFGEMIDQYESEYEAFAILAHDSAVCGSPQLASIFEGTGLEKWSEIDFREPYLAVIFNDAESIELIGKSGMQLVKELTLFGVVDDD